MGALNHREQLGSTGVGGAVAIPHAKIPLLDVLVGAFARIPDGVAFDSVDGKAVKLVFMLLVPENSPETHLKALARISRLLKDETFKDLLLETDSASALYNAIISKDEGA